MRRKRPGMLRDYPPHPQGRNGLLRQGSAGLRRTRRVFRPQAGGCEVKCPHCGEPINPAALLGTQAKGVPKKFTESERKLRSERLAAARKKRWPK